MIVPLIVLGTVACESGENDATGQSRPMPTSAQAVTTSVAPNSKEALEEAAHRLDLLASEGDAEAAYDYYSQRCKGIIGSLDDYKAFLTVWLKGRNPQYTSATAKVNGSSGQVVSIDEDPGSPSSSMNPRTWTFIDGRWQFDNC